MRIKNNNNTKDEIPKRKLNQNGVYRLSDSLDEWEQEAKRRWESEIVKLECDDANDAYPVPMMGVRMQQEGASEAASAHMMPAPAPPTHTMPA